MSNSPKEIHSHSVKSLLGFFCALILLGVMNALSGCATYRCNELEDCTDTFPLVPRGKSKLTAVVTFQFEHAPNLGDFMATGIIDGRSSSAKASGYEFLEKVNNIISDSGVFGKVSFDRRNLSYPTPQSVSIASVSEKELRSEDFHCDISVYMRYSHHGGWSLYNALSFFCSLWTVLPYYKTYEIRTRVTFHNMKTAREYKFENKDYCAVVGSMLCWPFFLVSSENVFLLTMENQVKTALCEFHKRGLKQTKQRNI